jgi:hypothetical protein
MYKTFNQLPETKFIPQLPSIVSITLLSLLGCNTPNQPESDIICAIEMPSKQTIEVLSADQVLSNYSTERYLPHSLGSIEVTEAFYKPHNPADNAFVFQAIINAHNKYECGEDAPQDLWTIYEVKQAIANNQKLSNKNKIISLSTTVMTYDCQPITIKWDPGVHRETLREKYQDDPKAAYNKGANLGF